MKYHQLLIASAALVLSACGGGSPRSPAETTNTSTSTTPVVPPSTSTTFCGTAFGSAAHCDHVFTSPAPPQAPLSTTTPFAKPTDIAQTHNGCDWEGNGAGVASAPTSIDGTIFLPAYTPGQTFPLIIHSHGWGGKKTAAPGTYPEDTGTLGDTNDPPSNTFGGLGDMLGTLRNRGYIVISFSERGWGANNPGSQARVIDPCYETVDAKAIVDWAVANLPVQMESTNDPVLGTLGGSYGGAFQIMLALHDSRVDTIVPVATWHQLAAETNHLASTSTTSATPLDASNIDNTTAHKENLIGALVAQEAIKRPYIAGLCALANSASLDPLILDACAAAASARVGNDMDNFNNVNAAGTPGTDMRKLFAEHGLGHSNYHPSSTATNLATAGNLDLDVLLFQGMRDVVFNGTESYLNYEYFRNTVTSGNEVKLITHDGGHMYSALENVLALNYQRQGNNNCGSVRMFDAILYWMDQKLKGNPSPAVAPGATPMSPSAAIPNVCIALDSANGFTVSGNNVPVGDPTGLTGTYTFNVTSAPLPPASTSIPNTATGTCTLPTGSPGPAGTVETHCQPAHFVPLHTATAGGTLAGVPVLHGTISANTPGQSPIATIAIGIQRGTQYIEVDEQVTAVRGYDDAGNLIHYSNFLLPMVGEQLQVGDIVGLLLYTEHPMFLGSNSIPSPGSPPPPPTVPVYNFDGTIELPIHP